MSNSPPKKRQRRQPQSSSADSNSSFTFKPSTFSTKKNRRLASAKSDEEEDNSDHSNDSPGTLSTRKHNLECPVKGCKYLAVNPTKLRYHYRKVHSKEKPYECTHPLCDYACDRRDVLIDHICKKHHLQTIELAMKYVKARKDILDKETKILKIRSKLMGDEVPEENHDSMAIEKMPTLPHFTTIHRTPTGDFICPFSECDKKARDFLNLKIHYRVHCGQDYRPFKCIFPSDIYCRYASNIKNSVARHIQTKHFNVPKAEKELNEKANDGSQYILTRTDWLEMEDTLFSSAEIVSPPEIQKPQVYECSFPNCSKKFTHKKSLRRHSRIHAQSMPFSCTFPNCGKTSTHADALRKHIQSIHFKILNKDSNKLSTEEKGKIEKYFQVNQSVLDEENAQMASIGISTIKKKRKRSATVIEDENDSDDNGSFYCPSSNCTHKSDSEANLKIHYLTHC